MKPIIAALLAGLLSWAASAPASAAGTQRVVLAGGCFWGMQAVFESLRGVDAAVAGYAGGNAATAHYEIVSTGMTGHAESVEITYDPGRISFKQLLDVYFLVAHDPTELNRQGPDEGTQYRSEIYYTSDAQRDEAAAYVAELGRKHVYASPIVTKIEPLRGFYAAESYHQDFAVHNPDNEYIVYNDLPKLRKLKELYPNLVKPNAPLISQM
ncbi:MAG: peptide-methionine (S)-S-oxide reductase MsrA [Candidatus Eremiobacteraeota bacterium]|nr:peptide-methionine (S)-S-oxide reductase MsrA [Candidatus Eremiobacteraeota bacterium]MBV8433632.1 peptide-methionine (S)-S-oxide reductase MsrA [Candidatus Eremiobacteraeota bacterium]MBV8722287.1 peptide-methionine (S)-S-oxide reductase MsrA [Candidatus Eremiobacteraeota bacterium]